MFDLRHKAELHVCKLVSAGLGLVSAGPGPGLVSAQSICAQTGVLVTCRQPGAETLLAVFCVSQ